MLQVKTRIKALKIEVSQIEKKGQNGKKNWQISRVSGSTNS